MNRAYVLMETGDLNCGEPDDLLGVYATLELAQQGVTEAIGRWVLLIDHIDVWITQHGTYRIEALPFYDEPKS